MTVVQRTSGDMRLNPHLHVVFLDGAYHEDGTELVWNELGHLPTRAVGQVLEHAGRMKLVAMVTEPRNIARFLSALGEPTDVPARSPSVHAAAAVLGVRGAGRRRRPGAPSVKEHRSAPQGAR
ncbi:hypothetical protein [Sorangium sp. So ce1000]|uniref:hypothetical protein n=1 Tax=Sorangium sp. So ce1000 TaxID=3133325 RepID=UPI003F63EABF